MAIPRKRKRKRRLQYRKPDHQIDRILVWADEFYARTGRWPNGNDGMIPLLDEKWSAINACLIHGCRGLPGGSSLADLLKVHRGRRNIQDLPPLDEEQILKWVQAHFRLAGTWPDRTTANVPGAPEESWVAIDRSLRVGGHGLPGGSSLPDFLKRHCGVRNRGDLPSLDARQILKWAGDHFRRTRAWPTRKSGAIAIAPAETWHAIDLALMNGYRSLPGGSSLAQFLQLQERVRNRGNLPVMNERVIQSWARDHFEQTGAWPDENSGPILCAPGETWNAINHALRRGTRGLPGGSSLPKLLAAMGVKRNIHDQPDLTIKQILQWADDHFRRHGQWPKQKSRQIDAAPLETWIGIEGALRNGRRGLSGSLSLADLLAQHRGVRNKANLPPLDEQQILKWAQDHFRRTGKWPTQSDREVANAQGETWPTIDAALRVGRRGLPGGSSLSDLLKKAGMSKRRRATGARRRSPASSNDGAR